MIALLDVNVLIALFDPGHVHHHAAHQWFADNKKSGWASCPLVENAVIRILSNPAYPGRRTTLQDAASRLSSFCSSGNHQFWADHLSIRESSRFLWNHVQGHHQLTDVYLLALAVSKGGRLVTFDGTISRRAVDGARPQNLTVIVE
ncbi:MAG: TA system VapC family ribonuclease toxin [Candidatus Binatia bacterium]